MCVSADVKDFKDRIHQGQNEGEADKALDSENLREWQNMNFPRTRIKV